MSASTFVDRAVLRKPYYGDTLTPRAESSLGNVNESRHNPQTISNAKTRDRQKDHRWNLSMQNMLSAIALLESSLDSSELVSPKLLPGCKRHGAFAPGSMSRSLLYEIKVSDAYAVHPSICNPNMFSRDTKHVLSSPVQLSLQHLETRQAAHRMTWACRVKGTPDASCYPHMSSSTCPMIQVRNQPNLKYILVKANSQA